VKRNVEIKARAADFERQIEIAVDLSSRPPQTMRQEDTYFRVERGRLKLRTFGAADGVLVQYRREDRTAPTESGYRLCPIPDAAELLRALEAALGVRGRVRKKRTLIWIGRTRVHFDEVEGLGSFIELEVEMTTDEDAESGAAVAADLMSRLGIVDQHLVERSYIDLLGDTETASGR